MLLDPEVAALGERAFFVRDGWLGREAALACHAELRTLRETLRPAGIGRAAAAAPTVRGDLIGWLEEDPTRPALSGLFRRFTQLSAALRVEAWLPVDRFDVQVACYPGGGAAYARHRDAFAGGPSRRVTAIWYANPGWQPAHGGVLRAHLRDQVVDVEPRLDRLVVFLAAEVEHEVLAAHAERYAVTAWYHGPG